MKFLKINFAYTRIETQHLKVTLILAACRESMD